MPIEKKYDKIELLGRVSFFAVFFLCLLILIGKVYMRTSNISVWDDAYMFVRYADNFIHTFTLSWNRGEEPTYGLTSVLYLLTIIPFRLIFSNSPGATAFYAGIFNAAAFLVLLSALIRYYFDSKDLAKYFILIVFHSFAADNNSLPATFSSGMDTTFVLLYITGYIFLCKWNEKKGSNFSNIATGIMGGFAFYARPDLLLYTFIIPGSKFLFGDKKEKKNAVVILATTSALVIAQVLFSGLYFQSYLPLPFYCKGLKAYDEEIYRVYRSTPYLQFLFYFCSYWCLFSLIFVNFFMNPIAAFKKLSPVEKGMLIATPIFICYYLFFVLQIMSSHARFYLPTLPAIVYLGGLSFSSIIEKIRSEKESRIPAVVLSLILFFVAMSLSPKLASTTDSVEKAKITGTLFQFDALKDYRANQSRYFYWVKLDEFSQLPDDAVIATTEVGLVSAMNPEKIIIDMAGLNHTAFAHKGFDADLLFGKYKPDLIYLPVKDYKKMIAQIVNHPTFKNDYVMFERADMGPKVAMSIAIKKSSPYYDLMSIVMREYDKNSRK